MSFHASTMEEHLARYAFALNFIKRKKVLDAGCFNGYGTQILSMGAAELVGYDVSPRALMLAGRRRYDCLTRFLRLDFDTEPWPEETFDTITCFEVIEHVTDPEKLLANLVLHLNPGGKLVFSVPHMIANRQHKTLFDEEKIKDLIGRYLTLSEFHIFDKKPFRNIPCYARVKDYVGVAAK